MKQFIIIIFAFLVCCCTKYGNPTMVEVHSSSYYLSESDAKKGVKEFLSAIPETKSNHSKRQIVSTWCPTAKTKSSGNGSDIYVFNFSDSLGFAIVSTDPKIGILGVSTKGTLTEDSDVSSSALSVILSRIEYIYDYPDTSDRPHEITYGYSDWTNHAYAPNVGYCPVKWGQRIPYCDYCRTDYGETSVTGCVATAVAQLMSMYRYPTSYQSYTFDWDAMINSPFSLDPSTGDIYVARLMQLLGTSENLDMDYLGTSAWTSSQYIPRTLLNFGFTNYGVHSSYHTNNVIPELQMGYPILMGGYDTRITTVHKNIFGHVTSTDYSYANGHEWLCDGLLTRTRNCYTYDDGILINTTLDTQHYLLCNFGYNGDYDGYYSEYIFNLNLGPSFPDPVETRSSSTTINSDPGNYKYAINTVTGIRP